MVSQTVSSIAALESALRASTAIREIRSLHDRLSAMQNLGTIMRMALREQNRIAAVRIHAIRRAVVLLERTTRGDRNGPYQQQPQTHISARQASRWRRIARIPDSVLSAYLSRAEAEDAEVSEEGLLRASKAASLDLHFSSARCEWLTPPEIIAASIRVMGAIDLDPCADDKKNVPAGKHYTEREDGLAQPWFGRVYMNPPYGTGIKAWVERLADSYETAALNEAIALLPARTDTAWFRRLRYYVRCFVSGRLTFSGHPHPAPFPSVVFYLGPNVPRFIHEFAAFGDYSTVTSA